MTKSIAGGILFSWKFLPGENAFSYVNDCKADMVTFTALAKNLFLENYYNTKVHVAGLGEHFIP